MTRNTLTSGVQDRLDAIVNDEPATVRAIDVLFDAFNEIERSDRQMHERLTGAFLDAMHALQRATWLDGWQCGRDPDKLVFAAGSLRHPDPDRAV